MKTLRKRKLIKLWKKDNCEVNAVKIYGMQSLIIDYMEKKQLADLTFISSDFCVISNEKFKKEKINVTDIDSLDTKYLDILSKKNIPTNIVHSATIEKTSSKVLDVEYFKFSIADDFLNDMLSDVPVYTQTTIVTSLSYKGKSYQFDLDNINKLFGILYSININYIKNNLTSKYLYLEH